jgi:3-dehydroquinate synthase
MIREFRFGAFETAVHINAAIPALDAIARDYHAAAGQDREFFRPLVVCDEHSAPVADALCGSSPGVPRCVLKSGEKYKTWPAIETILRAASGAGLGRDGVIIGVGGGVIGDLSAFAASVYMRGCGLVLVSTTLLGMVDASIGGKTGFDLFGVKNLAGTFYPARLVYMPLQSLESLPESEWKSGMAELIKTAVLAGDSLLDTLAKALPLAKTDTETLLAFISAAVDLKGRVVQADPAETGGERLLLNLGHSFGHALEASLGLGTITHGEAVAWGIVRSCELGMDLGITPGARAEKIRALIAGCGYETAGVHPLIKNKENFLAALEQDKKKRGGKLVFIVPDEKSARSVSIDSEQKGRLIG